jgi:hypothetical protein
VLLPRVSSISPTNPNTLVSANIGGNVATLSGPSGSYYFALLTAPAVAGPFTFTGLYGTNLVTSCGWRFSGGNALPLPTGHAGATMSYQIAAWESSLGRDVQSGLAVTARRYWICLDSPLWVPVLPAAALKACRHCRWFGGQASLRASL